MGTAEVSNIHVGMAASQISTYQGFGIPGVLIAEVLRPQSCDGTTAQTVETDAVSKANAQLKPCIAGEVAHCENLRRVSRESSTTPS